MNADELFWPVAQPWDELRGLPANHRLSPDEVHALIEEVAFAQLRAAGHPLARAVLAAARHDAWGVRLVDAELSAPTDPLQAKPTSDA